MSTARRRGAAPQLQQARNGAIEAEGDDEEADADEEAEVEPRGRAAGGSATSASATSKPIASGSRKALRTCAATLSQTRFGASPTSSAAPTTAAR